MTRGDVVATIGEMVDNLDTVHELHSRLAGQAKSRLKENGMLDLKITGRRITDGGKQPAFEGGIGLGQGVVCAIGKVKEVKKSGRLNGQGLIPLLYRRAYPL